jgi:hypothetical protein
MQRFASFVNPFRFLQRLWRYQNTWPNYLISFDFFCAAKAGREL